MFILYLLAKLVEITLSLVSLTMVLRMLLPLFGMDEDNKFYILCCFVSEPFVVPVRYVLAKLNIGQNSPLDFSFMLAYLVICLIRLFLPVI